MLNVRRLDWDSEFFGFGVGQIDGPFESVSALTTILQEAAESGFRLIYGICAHEDTASYHNALAAGGRLIDVKRTYALNLTHVQPVETNIEEASDDARSRRDLRSLAWQAAEFSRFRMDPALPKESWQRMYSIWMKDSLSGKLADAVLVQRVADRIVGMITVSHRENCGRIGLFAVDHRWRGRGIGRRLLEAAIQRCRAKGCINLIVVTQKSNLAACRSYERADFQMVSEQYIFHFWLDPTR